MVEANNQYIAGVMHAAAIKGIMEDARWTTYILPLIGALKTAAQRRCDACRRDPSFDNMVKASHFDGQVQFADTLLHFFTASYENAKKILDEAQTKLPSAPLPQGRPDGTTPAAPSGDQR